MKFELQEITENAIKNIRNRIENNSVQIDEIVSGIIQPYCKDLDKYVLDKHI